MKYSTTQQILDAIAPVCDLKGMTISSLNKDWRGREYESGLVVISETNNVGFEVFDNEIRVFYFTDHRHFEDYSFGATEDDEFNVRATEFLVKLFTFPIRYEKTTKGKTVKREEYFCCMQDKEDDSMGGTCVHLFSGNPFAKKVKTTTYWQYDKGDGEFVEYPANQHEVDTAFCSVVTRDDYVFNIEIDSARKFYSNMPKVFDSLSGYLPELTKFLDSLGIDIDKPVKYDKGEITDLMYTTFGTVTATEGYELDFFGDGKYVSAVIYTNGRIIEVELFGKMSEVDNGQDGEHR